MGGTTLNSLLSAPAPPASITLDMSKAIPIAQAAPVTLDMSKAQPINPTDQEKFSRTMGNMTAAMSGQPMATPDDQKRFDAGRQAGTIAGGVQLATSAGLGALTAPSVTTAAGPLAPAGRDAAGKFLPWVASQVTAEGPSLARQGVSAATDFLTDHPLAAQALKRTLQGLGVGAGLHFLKYFGGP
jgi:hypothetical protein